MKNLLLFAGVVSLATLASCGGKDGGGGGGMSAATKKNMEISEAIGKAFETKDFSKLGDYLSPEFVDYSAPMGPVKGIEENKKSFEQMAAMMDSSKMETITALGNDEFTMTWIKMKGKLKIDAMGMKAGEWMEGKAVEITKFKDGKAIEHWSYMDPADMAKMMPPPPAPAPAGGK
jgi:ketosteroid isomerase-like protein